MGTAYSWHPRVVVANPRWPRAQNLLADELFSSWLIRNAFAHGCSPMSLTGSLWPGWRCWTLDLDRGCPEGKLDSLAKMTGIGTADICSSTLRPIINALDPALEAKIGVWPWVLGLGARNRRHAGGLQGCPLCFSEDPPHYGLSSRLAWHTCCQKHLVRLIDSCPSCGAPLQPHLLEQTVANCRHCHRCHKPFITRVDDLAFAPGALAFQRAGDYAVRGLALGDSIPCEPSAWFYRARFIAGILRVSASNGSKTFTSFRDAFCLGQIARPDSGLPIELLSVRDRMDLLAAVWKVMDMGEQQLINAIVACALPRHSISVPAGDISAPLQAMLEMLPVGKSRNRVTKGFQSPASQHTVDKLWARLKRKVLRDG